MISFEKEISSSIDEIRQNNVVASCDFEESLTVINETTDKAILPQSPLGQKSICSTVDAVRLNVLKLSARENSNIS